MGKRKFGCSNVSLQKSLIMALVHICISLWIHGIHTRQHKIKSQYHCTMNIVHTVVGSKDETKFDIFTTLTYSLGNFKSSFN